MVGDTGQAARELRSVGRAHFLPAGLEIPSLCWTLSAVERAIFMFPISRKGKSMLRRLWNEDEGAILSAELVLFGTILVIGMITGLSSVQTAVVTELGDLANAVGAVNQSYSYGGVLGHHAQTPGSIWNDGVDTCDEPVAQDGPAPACMELCATVAPEL